MPDIEPVRLAIVGSTAFASPDTPEHRSASLLINELLDRFHPDEVLSGGARGIDSMAAMAAHARGIPTREFLPQTRRWAPNGFMDRNLLIADRCTHLVRITHHASTTYGSGWTADQTEKQGKPVERYLIDADGGTNDA